MAWTLSVSPRVRGLILLNMLAFLCGSNIAVVKQAQKSLTPAGFAFARFAIAAIPFTPLLRNSWVDKECRLAGLELGLWSSLAYLAQAESVVTTPGGRASLISTFTVIVIPIIAGIFGARIPHITWFATIAALFGVSLLNPPEGSFLFSLGDFWMFLSSVLFGIHILRSEHYTKNIGPDLIMPLVGLQMVMVTVLSGVLFSSPYALSPVLRHSFLDFLNSLTVENFLQLVGNLPWVAMIYTGLFSTALALWIEIVSLKDVTATEAAMVYTLEPLHGAMFAWVLLNERWGVKGWIGILLILAGSLSMQLLGSPTQSHELQVIDLNEDLDEKLIQSEESIQA